MALHAIGAVLLVGRLAHAYGLSQTPHIMQLRVFGMVATFTAIIVGRAACLSLSLLAHHAERRSAQLSEPPDGWRARNRAATSWCT